MLEVLNVKINFSIKPWKSPRTLTAEAQIKNLKITVDVGSKVANSHFTLFKAVNCTIRLSIRSLYLGRICSTSVLGGPILSSAP